MLDETKPRLIVMGGTTEPGVIQIEIMGAKKSKCVQGSIVHASEVPFSFATRAHGCRCKTAFRFTDETIKLIGKHEPKVLNGANWGLCHCAAKRLD